jgi:hypothetical protein
MTFLLLLSLIPAAHADQAKSRMRSCLNDDCKTFITSAEIFKRRYCKGDEKLVSYRPNCYQSVEKVVVNVMRDSKYPQKADHEFWAKFVKEGEIHVPAGKRSDF